MKNRQPIEKQNSVGLNMIEPSIIPGSREGRQVEMSPFPHNQNEKQGFSNLERSYSNTDLSSAYEKPNYRLLQKTLSETHPRNKFNKKYSCCEICCKFDSGAHCMCYTSSSSDFDKFGLGTVLYFRFLKYITFFFFLFALLSVPALVLTLGVSHDFSINGLKDYKGALYLTTLGSLQRGTTSCTQTQLNSSINFACERGVLGPLSTLQYGRSYEDPSLPCNLFNIYSWDTQCNNNDIQFIQTGYANCEGQSSCNLQLSQDFFDFSRPGCDSWNPDVNSDARFYISAYCEETTFSLFEKSNISKMTLGYIIASIDALICVIYVIMLIVLRKMEKKTIFYLEGNVQSVSGYTLKISNLPKSSCDELKRDLWKHFSEVKENGNIITYNIVDVQIAESQSLLDLQIQLANLKKKKYQLYKKFLSDWSNQYQNISKLPTYEDIRKLASKGNKHMIKEFHDIEKVKEKQSKLKKKIEHQKKHLKHVPIAAFVTFGTQQEKNDAEMKFHKSHFSRFAFRLFPSFYRKDINVFQGKSLKVKAALSTDNILWANIGVSKFQKFLRRILSWVITIGFWAISFALIVVVKTKQEDSSSLVQPTLDCSNYPDLTEQQVLDDIAQGANALGFQECFCRNDFERQLLVGVCREWASQKLIVNALPFLAVIGIIVINYCLQYVFKLLSNYEKHSDISTQSTSRVIKIFVAQFLNTGVILLIVNAKFSRRQINNFLEGTYTDLTSDWFLNVGTILLLTMILNIVNLPFVNLVFYLIGAMRRCFDRNCTCDHKSTSKETQEDWVKLYTGPEFLVDFRYAQILTIIFICFLYSPGIPILYLTSFLNLLVIYWMDKFLVLRICRLSKTFDDTMENVVRKTLFFALFFHLVSAVWTYGNSQLFSGESYFIKQLKVIISAQNREDSFFISSMKYRAIEGYNISLTVLFALFVVALLLRLFLKNTFYRFKAFCSKRHHRKVSDEAMCTDPKTYYDFIHLEDLQREKKYLEREMYESSDSELKAFLGQRLERISKEIQRRSPEEENRLTKFRGPFSYFVGHNKAFQSMFPIEDVPFPHAPMI